VEKELSRKKEAGRGGDSSKTVDHFQLHFKIWSGGKSGRSFNR
jgi:hypothetical protein